MRYYVEYVFMGIAEIIIIVVLILSIVLHEVAHGFAANALGDPTARLAGRLNLNPINHIDPMGSIIVPLLLFITSSPFLFGWAKPVPYNPYNLRNQRWGEAMVAFAGPATNFLLAIIFAAGVRFAPSLGLSGAFIELSSYIVLLNVVLGCFNLIPFPPLDGSKVIEPFLPPVLRMRYHAFGSAMEHLGILGSVLILSIFMFVLGKPFFSLVQGITELLLGFPFL